MVNRSSFGGKKARRRRRLRASGIVLWDINQLVNMPLTATYGRAAMPPYAARSAGIRTRGLSNLLLNRGWCDSTSTFMTHFPQPHPSRRASRVQLGDSVLAAIRLEDGRRTKAKLQTISVTGGLLQLAQSLAQGDFVEVAFQTQAGPVHGMAEVLHPTQRRSDGVLQAFRFVALEEEDHRRLRTSLDHVADRNLLGMKSSGFSTY